MSAIFRRKDFSRFDFVILANNSQPWDNFKIGHGEGVYGWNFNVASFYLPEKQAQIAVVNGYRSFPKCNFSFDYEKFKEFIENMDPETAAVDSACEFTEAPHEKDDFEKLTGACTAGNNGRRQ